MVVGAFVDVVLKRFGERLADRSVEGLAGRRNEFRWRAARVGDVLTEDVVREAVESHLVRVSNWAVQLQFARMVRPRPTRTSTLELDFTAVPRRFRPYGLTTSPAQGQGLTEQDLLDDVAHYVLTGDPGAGKTTTVKRLISRLLEAPAEGSDVWGVPLLIVLREHSDGVSLPEIVLEELGLLAGVQELLKSDETAMDTDQSEATKGLQNNADARRNYELMLSLHQVVAAILDACGAVLFLDGLDEVHLEYRSNLAASITRLAQQVTDTKIIVTCRSGDLRFLDGFSTAEICALTSDQIHAVASAWLGDRSPTFMAKLRRGSASELANRPLFLCQMLTLFDNTETIPDQPSLLHHQMIRLVLQDWDQERQLTRGSRYKNFDTDTKLRFLSALSYRITFALRERSFDHTRLLEMYQSLHHLFALPAGEAEQVVNEIETHTGILVDTGGKFEFSHSSIQEYLAADHIVRLPDDSNLPNLFKLYSPPVAVATALSSDPSRFLARLTSLLSATELAEEGRSFVTRLLSERPRFAVGLDLGVGVLKILLSYRDADDSVLLDLMDYPGVSSALAALIDEHYTIRSGPDPYGPLVIQLRDQPVASHVTLPMRGTIVPRVATRFLESLSRSSNVSA